MTIPRETGRKRRPGLRVHRVAALRPDDTTTRRGIPITTPVRTIIDLARTLKGRPLEHALDFAELHRRLIPPSFQAVLSRYTAGASVTRSEMEERFLALCDAHQVPRPNVNTRIESHEVDFAWRDAHLIVEVDGYAYHRAPSAFETDRERDVTLALAGWTVLRFTWTQLTTRPKWVARAVSGRCRYLDR